MSNQTVFFILGISLVVVALVVSFAGLRFQKFPPSRVDPDRWRCVRRPTGRRHRHIRLAKRRGREGQAAPTSLRPQRRRTRPRVIRLRLIRRRARARAPRPRPRRRARAAGRPPRQETRRRALSSSTSRAAPAVTRSPPPARAAPPGRTSMVVLKGKTPDFIKTSIIDPNADITQGYPARRDAAELRRHAERRADRLARRLPGPVDQRQVTPAPI